MWFFENSPLFSCLKKWMHGDAAIKNRLVDMGAGGEGTGRRGRRRWEELRVAWKHRLPACQVESIMSSSV